MARLALTLALMGAACAPESLGPTASGGDGLGGRVEPPAVSGGGGSPLVGEWELVTVIAIGTGIQTSGVHWTFAGDASCRQAIRSWSFAEGVYHTTVRECTYANATDGVRVVFAGAAPAVFTVSFAAFSPNRLVLDGLEYRRAG